MSDETLKPCPFCGSDATLVEVQINEVQKYDAVCENEDCPVRPALLRYSKSREDAILKWNTRA